MVEKLDEIAEENQKKILHVLVTNDKGEGVTWRTLLEKSGLAKATLSKHLKRLIEKGVINESISKKDRRIKVYKINKDYDIFIKMISEIRRHIDLFDEYARRILVEMLSKCDKCETKEEFDEALNIFERKLTFCRRIIFEELDRIRYDIINLDISEELRKDLLYETFKIEMEINKKYARLLFDKGVIKKFNPFKVATPSDFAILKQVESDLRSLKKEMEVKGWNSLVNALSEKRRQKRDLNIR